MSDIHAPLAGVAFLYSQLFWKDVQNWLCPLFVVLFYCSPFIQLVMLSGPTRFCYIQGLE